MEKGRNVPGGGDGRSGVKSSFAAGVAALVFLVIGYQSALFIHKASVLKILGNKDAPDTVFVIDKALAESILKPLSAERLETMRKTVRGKDVYAVRKESPHSPEVMAVRSKAAPKSVENFRFDPNTVAVPDLNMKSENRMRFQAGYSAASPISRSLSWWRTLSMPDWNHISTYLFWISIWLIRPLSIVCRG